MAGRPKQEKADIPKLQQLHNSTKQVIDPRPIIALTMAYCGATYREIGEAFNLSRQQAETILKNAEKELMQ